MSRALDVRSLSRPAGSARTGGGLPLGASSSGSCFASLAQPHREVPPCFIAECCGSVMAEYVAVLSLVSVGLAVASYHLGPGLVRLYDFQRALLSVPLM